MPKQWFHNWFNSPYYHLLYNKRDHSEAEYFINNLLDHLKPDSHAQLLDIACGRGRHSVYLNQKGFEVTGIDLSIENIHYARQFETPTLHFFVHDMRSLCYVDHFDIAFNLFTSFGYFKTEDEHIGALKNFNKALKVDGLLVLDFFNSRKILKNLVAEDVKTVNGIDFHIHKKVDEHKITKSIIFEDGDKSYNFKEVVNTFTVDDFTRFFELSGFKIMACFGNYSLEEFDIDNSDRLIFICKKIHA
jgi:SAM-dependent methyltransferase